MRRRHTVVGMIAILSALASLLSFRVRSRAFLKLEIVALRHQVAVLRRQRSGRLRLFCADRLLWVWLYRIWPQALHTMVLVKPATVVQWHRKGFRLYWRWRSRSRQVGRPKTSTDIRDLIRRMSMANPIWGAPRIHGELLMLGIEVSQATVGEINAVATQGPLPDLAQLTPCFSVGLLFTMVISGLLGGECAPSNKATKLRSRKIAVSNFIQTRVGHRA